MPKKEKYNLKENTENKSDPRRNSSERVFDVVIVGMGPAGLYSAWRLLNASDNQKVLGHPAKTLKIGLYDTMPENRVGGRLCTQPLPNYPFLAELGGMRFRTNQLLVSSLVDAIGLKNDVKNFDFPQRYYFLREKKLTDTDFRDETSVTALPYQLKNFEKNLPPHKIIEIAIHNILKSLKFGHDFFNSRERSEWSIRQNDILNKLKTVEGLHSLSAREWAIIKRFGEYRNSNFLHEVGFWDLLQFQLSSGGWHLANDGLGYESIMGNWNAAIALPWFIDDFAESNFVTMKNGMKSITDRLYREVKRSKNVSVQHKFDLTSIDLDENSDSQNELIRLQFSEDENPVPQFVLTKSLILALPKGALIRLNYGDRLMTKVNPPKEAPKTFDKRLWVSDLLHSVDGRALFKLFLGYPTPWWTRTNRWKDAKSKITHGKVNTDLPLRQIYHYGKEQWNKDRQEELGLSPNKHQHSMIMASYSDSHYIEFWSELKKDKNHRYKGFGKGAKLSDADRNAHEEFGAPLSMIIRAEHQLGLLYGTNIKDVPKAEVGLYMEWSRPPYYAGWHSWKVGVKPWEICDGIMRPFGNTNIFVCGEAYSNEQGWVEGALKSAERLMTLIFKLRFPPEMLKDYFNGDKTALKYYIDAVD